MAMDEAALALAAVESLRAGVPTRLATRLMPDIRKPVTDMFLGDLASLAAGGKPEGRILWGEYGQGKTHMLTTLAHAALERGFAVSMIALSREVSLHQLLPFYGRAAAALRVPDSVIPGILAPLLRRGGDGLANSPIKALGRYPHPLPAIVLEDLFASAGEEQDLLYGDLVGCPLAMSEVRRIHRACRGEAMPRFAERFRAHLHAPAYFGVMADAIRYSGYQGWVILLDEVELAGRLGKASRLLAYRHLALLLGWMQAMPYPIYVVAATASRLKTERMYEGSSRQQDDRSVFPDLAAERFGPGARQEMEHFFKRAISTHCPSVRQATQSEVATVLDRVVQLHGLAYDWPAQLDVGTLLAQIPNVPVRTQIRAALEALDQGRLYREATVPTAGPLAEASLAENEGFFTVP